jgi:hypothetical protein
MLRASAAVCSSAFADEAIPTGWLRGGLAGVRRSLGQASLHPKRTRVS